MSACQVALEQPSVLKDFGGPSRFKPEFSQTLSGGIASMKNCLFVFLIASSVLHAQHVTASSTCNAAALIDVAACYGADPTGISDSSAALNKAFSAHGTGERYIPPGTYKVSSTLLIDTRYKVTGAGNETHIQAGPGFTGTLANVVSTYAQTSVVLGGMDGLFFDCQGTAAVGVLYGGHHRLTVYGYQTSNTVMHNCRTAGAQVGANSWGLAFYNVGFQGNRGVGFEMLDQFNMGENISCYSCNISNNNIGIVMGSSTRGFAHDFFCYGCAIDFNSSWGIQNQTATSGDSIVGLYGGHFETAGPSQRWIQNFGRMHISGSMMSEDTGTAPSYLIDNENYLVWESGRDAPNAAPATLNPAQRGFTHCIAVVGLSAANCTTFLDAGSTLSNPGGLIISGYISTERLQQPAASTYAGKCTMSRGTNCTFTTAARFTHYLSLVSIDPSSSPPTPAISAKCSLSGTTATITAGAANSLTWDCLFVGNPF
jgi:hypothetical protein